VHDGLDLLAAQRRVFASALTGPEKLVALALLDHWSLASQNPFPGVDRLAVWTSFDRRTVLRMLSKLEQRGAIVVTRRVGTVNRYSLGQLELLPVTISHQCQTITSVTESRVPVSEDHPTSDTRSLPPVTHDHPKDPIEGSQEGTQARNPPLRLTAPNDTPKPATAAKRSKQGRVAAWRRVPEAWQASAAHREQAKTLGVNFDVELAKFRDHEFAKPRTDADAAFRNWLRTAGERTQGAQGRRGFNPQRGVADPNMLKGRRADWLDGGGK